LGLLATAWMDGLQARPSVIAGEDNAAAGPTVLAQRLQVGYPTRGTRRGGASRGGGCELPAGTSPLTALMPADPNASAESLAPESVISLTYRAVPELWFYMPYSLNASSQVDFVVKNVDDDTLLRAQLAPEGSNHTEPGLIQVSFADFELSLMPETGYHWYLTVRCDGGGVVSVDGWLQYQSAEPVMNTTPDTAPESISIRAEFDVSQGFWVDGLTSLRQGLQNAPSPEQLQTTWQSLLAAEGLSDIVDQPVRDCCAFVTVQP
ncbi:MAG: DUF928 domain-containing protein, partial [Cyanobacteria bacterium J06632_22]